jgi:hypothetical protein
MDFLISRVGTRKSPARLGPKKICVARLPITGSDLFGREEDIGFLDNAWANPQVNVLTIVAWAGRREVNTHQPLARANGS